MSAPSEESGIGTINMLFQSISALMTRCDAVDVTIRRADHPQLVEYTVRQTPSTVVMEACRHSVLVLDETVCETPAVLDKPPPAAA